MRHHLAILQEAYLDAILAGRKTIECRLTRSGAEPFRVLQRGDLLWLKQSCGPIRAVASVVWAEHLANLTPTHVDWICEHLNYWIAAPKGFFVERRGARFGTLAWLGRVCALQPFSIRKSDRLPWVALAGPPVPNCPLRRQMRRLA